MHLVEVEKGFWTPLDRTRIRACAKLCVLEADLLRSQISIKRGLGPWPGALHLTRGCLKNVWLPDHLFLGLPAYTTLLVLGYCFSNKISNKEVPSDTERNRARRLRSPFLKRGFSALSSCFYPHKDMM